MEGNLRFKIDWASLLLGSKLTTFASFYFVFEGNFASTSTQGAYVWRGDLMEGFLCYWFGGLIFGGAYFRNFMVCKMLQMTLPIAFGFIMWQLLVSITLYFIN